MASLLRVPVTPVRELELDLDAFEGPFDLLLTLLLKEALEPREIDISAIVLSFLDALVDRSSRPRTANASPPPEEREASELDLEVCGEFLVLISALLELKARSLFPDEAADLDALEPEEAAEELARRLAEYRRMKEAAAWLVERLSSERDRWFRLGPAALAPQAERRLAPQDPEALATALRALAVPPPNVSLSHMALRFPPVSQFLERFRALLSRRRRFDFESEVGGLSRVEQAVAFLALLELRKSGEIALSQAAPFAPIRVSRSSRPWTAASPAGRSPTPPPPDAAHEPLPSGAVRSTVPSGLGSSEMPQEREEGFDYHDDERTLTWTARSA
jgi:segregation and condensation protein A